MCLIKAIMLQHSSIPEHEIDEYLSGSREDYILGGSALMCISEKDDYVFVMFAWHDGTMKAAKSLYRLGNVLYHDYTLKGGKPILFKTLGKWFDNNSEPLGDGVFKFIPTNML